MLKQDERHDNGPQDPVTVSFGIQIAIDEMRLCFVVRSLAYAYAYTITSPPPWGTLFTTLILGNR